MPIYKFRSFAEAERALWNFNPDEAYFRRVAQLWEFANMLSPMAYPRGIFKYRSIEEADKEKREWDLANAKKLQAKRAAAVRRRES